MKKPLSVILAIFYIACGSSTVQHRTDSPSPEETEEEVFSYYNQSMDMTLLITEVKSVLYRLQPPVGNPVAGMFVSMSAIHQTNRLTRTPNIVSFNISTPVRDLPPKLLLINFSNNHWIKVEPEVVDGVYVSVIPLTSMETFLDAERSGFVGFLGDDRRFAQFAVNGSTVELFRRFLFRLYQTQPEEGTEHRRSSNLPYN